MSYYFVLQKLLLLCLLPRALPFLYFCATKRTVAVGPPGLFCNVSFAAPTGIYPQFYSCPSLNCATESVRAFCVVCYARKVHTHAPEAALCLHALLLRLPSVSRRPRPSPSERGLSFPDRRVFYGLCEGCRGARSCARREKEEGKAKEQLATRPRGRHEEDGPNLGTAGATCSRPRGMEEPCWRPMPQEGQIGESK